MMEFSLSAACLCRLSNHGHGFAPYRTMGPSNVSTAVLLVMTMLLSSVATDDNNIVITNNTAVDTLLGPMVRYGANPWPWFDNRHKQAADNENSIMDSYFPAWWDTPAPGTVTVTNNS